MSKDTDRPTADDGPPTADYETGGNEIRANVSRRAFLRGALATGAGALLAACGVEGDVRQVQPPGHAYHTATARSILQSPQARPGAGTPEPGTPEAPAEGALGLEQFLTLSAVLTGVSSLDPVVGRVYLQALQAGDFDLTLSDLYQQAGFDPDTTPTLDDVEQAGVFDDDAAGTLANTIIRYWYTGIYDTPDGEQAVATYVDALAWKALPWTKPKSICGTPGFWEKRPDIIIPFDPNPTSTPTPAQSTNLQSPISNLQSPRNNS